MKGLEFEHRHRVTYSECTLGNHVYYGNYLALLEEARGEFFRHLGATFLAWQERGVLFPVTACAFRFLAPARYDDVVTVRLWLTQLRGARLSFAYRLVVEPGRGVLEGETHHACTSLEDKPRRLPPELIERLHPYLHLPPPAAPVGDAGPGPA